MAIETIREGNLRVEIEQDLDPENPRDWDNLGLMVCFHRRYNLGDDLSDYKRFLKRRDHARYTPETLMQTVASGDVIALPLYLYDHSLLAMSTRMETMRWQHWQWDAGLVGYIIVDRQAVREEWGWQRISRKRERFIESLLRNEVETYDQWLSGQVYGYTSYCDKCGAEVDSCWGFFGTDWQANGLLEYATSESCCD